MPFPKPVIARAGNIVLHIEQEADAAGNVQPITGHVLVRLVTAAGEDVRLFGVPLEELTANQRTTLTNYMNAIRTRANSEAV